MLHSFFWFSVEMETVGAVYSMTREEPEDKATLQACLRRRLRVPQERANYAHMYTSDVCKIARFSH